MSGDVSGKELSGAMCQDQLCLHVAQQQLQASSSSEPFAPSIERFRALPPRSFGSLLPKQQGSVNGTLKQKVKTSFRL